jgi:2-keto-3-deoxy-L-rhamnonate aldolase RhmA
MLERRIRIARTLEGEFQPCRTALESQTKRKLKAGELVLFMGVNQMRTPNIAMIAAACGFDGVYIDLEHNPTSLETAAAICVAALGPSALHPSPVSAPATRTTPPVSSIAAPRA